MRRRRRRRRRVFLRLILLLLILLLYSNFYLKPREYRVAPEGLPPEFDGFRIVQISDLHGRTALNSRIIRKTRRAEPDIIAITGDLVDGEGQLEALKPMLKELCDIAPCYYVTGNHEWSHMETEVFIRELKELGVRPLRNRFTELSAGDASVTLAGVEDRHGYRDMITPAELAEKLPEGTSILLCHAPDDFKALAEDGYSLVLSGHVHGGLIRLPLLGGLFGPGRVFLPEYTGGIYEEGDSRMVVSRGLAGSGPLPRLFNAPELTVVILTSEEGGS